ncbi:hypothetical protein ZHAS_00004023 [Anopheles sinensis]|uniref:Uncharacterized protein n=1 Tax=Anopheles sinensis TaxID=74873 RepID=A0A084VFW6_ANOSI|nr:hypothetical protein ZHAS_00004023 [Anopheles sinensis]
MSPCAMSGLLQQVVPLSRRMFGGPGRLTVRTWLLLTLLLLLTSVPSRLQSTSDADRGLHKRDLFQNLDAPKRT